MKVVLSLLETFLKGFSRRARGFPTGLEKRSRARIDHPAGNPVRDCRCFGRRPPGQQPSLNSLHRRVETEWVVRFGELATVVRTFCPGRLARHRGQDLKAPLGLSGPGGRSQPAVSARLE